MTMLLVSPMAHGLKTNQELVFSTPLTRKNYSTH